MMVEIGNRNKIIEQIVEQSEIRADIEMANSSKSLKQSIKINVPSLIYY